jgi:hypothetical protein
MDDSTDLGKGEEQAKPVTRLENMDVSFVSLVTAGANRQKAFMIIKALTCPACGAAVDPADETCPACGVPMPTAAASKIDDSAPRDASAGAPQDLDESPPPAVEPGLASTREETMGKLSASPSEPSLPVASAADFLAKLAEASETIALSMAEVAFAKDAAAVALPPAALSDPPLAPLARVETAKADPSETIAKALAERELELSAVRAELEKARQAQTAAEARARALKATVGASHAMPSGEIAKTSTDRKQAAPRKLWAPDMNTLR